MICARSIRLEWDLLVLNSWHLPVDDVTKIEVVLEEAPDAVIIGSMSSELEATTELNSTFPDGEFNNLI